VSRSSRVADVAIKAMAKPGELSIGLPIPSSGPHKVCSGRLDGKEVTVTYYGGPKLPALPTVQVEKMAELDDKTKVYFDTAAHAVCVIKVGSRPSPIPKLDEVKAMRMAATVLERVAKVPGDTADDVFATGVLFRESLTGSDQAGGIHPVYMKVIGEMTAPAGMRLRCDSAGIIFRQLAAAPLLPRAPSVDPEALAADPEPDPQDVSIRRRLATSFTPMALPLVKAVAVEEPSREIAETWLEPAERLVREVLAVAPDELAPALAREVDELRRSIETSELDDPAYVEERAETVASAFISHWTSTLAEVLERNDAMAALGADLWPTSLEEPHRTEYERLLDQFGLSMARAQPAWKEFRRVVLPPATQVDLPERLRLIGLGTGAILVRR
jgi:hypothetical protein